MTRTQTSHRHERQRETLHRLLRDRGLHRYGLFFVTGEGTPLPDGLEATSGFVIDERGQVYSFWLGWDDDRQQAALTEWQPVEADPRWERSAEYRRARDRAATAA